MGSIEVLKKRVPSDPNVARLIDAAMQGTTRGASLTQRMLAFARQQELRTTSTDLGGLVLGMQELLQRSIGPQIAMQIHARRGLKPALVDPHQVELAVLNLAINARDAMPQGGSLSIRLDPHEIAAGEDTTARLGAKLKPGPYLCIKVIDSGMGMDAETLAKAIEPFFSTKPAGRGTGLGLSMTHGLAMQLGGALTLDSKLGKGTTAALWLPAASAPAAADRGVELRLTPTSPKRILLVDDDPLVAMSTIDMLIDLGHSVTEANSAEGALEILEGGAPLDLIVTDHAMPGMTGTELAAIVRKRRPELKVLLVTGYSDVPVAQQAKLPRLAKPYFQSQLQAAIAELLDAPAAP
jgi:CheY-like chemotaxis protein